MFPNLTSLRRRHRSTVPSPRSRFTPILPAEVWKHICNLISAEAFGIIMVISLSQLSTHFIGFTAHAFIMHMPISPFALQHVVGLRKPLKRIMVVADAHFRIMKPDAFNDTVLIQLCLQHRAINSILSVEGVIRILLLSLRSVHCPFHRRLQSDTLEEQFAWLQKGLHLNCNNLEVIVNPAIPFMQRNYRYKSDDLPSVHNVITLLHRGRYMPAQNLMSAA